MSLPLPLVLSTEFGKQFCLLPWPTVLTWSDSCLFFSLTLPCSSLPFACCSHTSFFLFLQHSQLVPTGGCCTKCSSVHLDHLPQVRDGWLLLRILALGHIPAPQRSFMTTSPFPSRPASSTLCPHFFTAVIIENYFCVFV